MRQPLDAGTLSKHAPDEFHLLIQLIPSCFYAPPDLFGMVAAILELVDSEATTNPKSRRQGRGKDCSTSFSNPMLEGP